jgi:hypothetical protein
VAQVFEEVEHVVGGLLLDRKDRLHQDTGGRIVAAEPPDDLAVRLDGDPFGDEIFADAAAASAL